MKGGITGIVNRRSEAQKKLALNPSDPEAILIVEECDQQVSLAAGLLVGGQNRWALQMRQWAESKNLPGAFSGSTGVKCLTADQLAPRDKRFQAWTTPVPLLPFFRSWLPRLEWLCWQNQLRRAAAVESKVGLHLLMKMGWQPGEGLGRGRCGALEPLVLDIKSDRKGLVAAEEAPRHGTVYRANKGGGPRPDPGPVGVVNGKNPISALMELCAKRRWHPPSFDCAESGAFASRRFLWKVTVNGQDYQAPNPAAVKKVPSSPLFPLGEGFFWVQTGKAVAATIALQALGILPKEP